MGKKIIAVGNMVMCDDGIGIKIAEFLLDDFRNLEFQLIIGESDINYCMEEIENDDFIIILTSSYYDITPGTVTLTPIEKIDLENTCISQQGINFLISLNKYNKNINGFFITVEASEFYFNPDLSPALKSKFNNICEECLHHITSIYYTHSTINS